MRIKSLQLTNFRCFENLELEFADRLTVILGINGSGKTAILDALNFPVERFIMNLHTKRTFTSYIDAKDVKNGTNSCSLEFKVVLDDKVMIDEYNKSLIRLEDILNKFAIEALLDMPLLRYQPFNQYLKEFKKKTITNLPVFVYSRSDMRGNKLTFKYNDVIKQLLAYDDYVKPRLHDFHFFSNWFESLTNYENATRLDGNPAYRNPQLQLIRHVLTFFMAQIHQSHFKDLRIKKSAQNETLFSLISSKLIITKNDIDLDLIQLSAGEKAMLLLVIDIAMRLAIANPSRENALEGEGIILIDEIELHLHPQWQRQIIPALMATFPNCQFILTTHSPQVVSQVKRDNIVILENNQLVQNVPFTYGKDSNTLLNEVFQTPERPIEIQKQLDMCFKLIDMENWVEAKNALRQLATILGEKDTEILRANAML
jgi:predicted ATP-binding protein involved in virulence